MGGSGPAGTTPPLQHKRIALLYRGKIHGAGECAAVGLGPTIPIESAQPAVQERVVVTDHPEVALEQGVVGGVEAGDGGVEPDVCVCDVGTEEEGGVGGGEVGFETVEGGEERVDGFVVGGLGAGEAAFVDAVVDGGVDPGVHGGDLGLFVWGEEGLC
ncbi:hypothetical protein EYC80_008761 [Monilinia laxa]|uniref:Uncharacterized protein n=1 Tax=Monilinia laxa TaxID=61186 RepID=A0A5N6K1F3_MONLA|nr:hypothetical protein EYC80_008761 [Monilinia laxa]